MIDSLEKLHDHADRYRPRARRGGVEADMVASMRRPNVFHDGRLVDSLDGWEFLTRDGWVPIADYDDGAVAARVERLEALYNFEMAVNSYERQCANLRRAWGEMSAEDSRAWPIPDLPPVLAPTDEYIAGVRAQGEAD